MAWLEWLPWVGDLRIDHKFFYLTLILVALSIAAMRRIVHSPFGRILTAIRDNPERTQFIGINVRLYQLTVFSIAGGFAGLAGGLFGIFNRGVFPDFAYWTKSSEVLIMTLLGGMGTFYGPAIGALALIWLNQQIVSYTQYWPLILGSILVILLFVFPGGLAGAVIALWRRLVRSPVGA
jgi:branched-chain amino acid transport system permease protein